MTADKQPSEKWSHLASDRPEPQTEEASEAHRLFRERDPAHQSNKEASHPITGIVSPGSTIPATGVLYVSERATANGWTPGHPEWANFGQGAPEVGPIPGGSERPSVVDLAAMGEQINEYAPTTGVTELREAVAKLYNETYRQGMKSQYTKDNVCIVPGGRAGLTRVASVVGDVFVSYQLPDYTAYANVLSSFKRLVPVAMALDAEDAYHLNIDKLRERVLEEGISVVLASNPRNPTGQVIANDELSQLVKLSRDEGTTMILDEFYSWYQYADEHRGSEGGSVSAAAFVEDVDKDPVILIDGLTKNWRLPGWRCCWVIGPKSLVGALGQCGGFLDGGASHPFQVAAIPLLEPSRVKQDRIALQRHFKQKRDHVLARLDKMGLHVANAPTSTFYIWLDLSQLPAPLSSGLVFFEELLKHKTIVVPGAFFDLNPSQRRNLFSSPCHHFVRLSFGPKLEELDRGLDGIERLLNRVQEAVKAGGDIYDLVGKDLAEHKKD